MDKHYVCDKHKTKGNTGKCPFCHPDHFADATEKVQPAPAPLPEVVAEALRRFAQDCPTCTDTVHNHISDLTRRLAEAEAELAARTRLASNAQDALRHARSEILSRFTNMEFADRQATASIWVYDLEALCSGIEYQLIRAEAAEARVRELERDNAGRFEHVVKVEAERDALREQNGKLAVQRADAVHLAKANPTQAYQRIQQFKERAEAAEASVRELEMEEEERKAGWQLAGDAARGLRVECDGDLGHEAEQIRSERDALRERCGKLEWLVEVQEFYMYRLRNPGGWSTPGMEREKIGVAWQRRSAANDELRAMYLAATEVKP